MANKPDLLTAEEKWFFDHHRHLIPDEIRELEQAAVAGQRKKVVDRLLNDLATDAD